MQLVKVAAHTGNFGNDLADHIAKQAAVSGKVWSLPFCDLTDIWFLPTHGRDSPVEGDLQAYLKLQSQFRASITWKYCECVQQQIPYFDSVDWDSTILNLHNGNLPGSLVTSIAMCSDRAYRVKVLHGMLPTASRLLVTRPDLYQDDLCPRCLLIPETANHLWLCTHSQEVLRCVSNEGSCLF